METTRARLVGAIVVATLLLGTSAYYFLKAGVEKTIVSYNEDTGKFVRKESKPTTGSITIEEGDSCYAVEGIFVVCGQ